jgi:hypothetical protein
VNTASLAHLTPNERAAIAAYLAQLRQHIAVPVLAVILFGSKARGDADTEADIDLLVLLERETHELRTSLWHIAADISLDFNVVLSPRVFGRARWAEAQQMGLPLYRAIMADGIALTPEHISV